MAMYRIELNRDAAKSLSGFDRTTQTRIRTAIDALAVEPHPTGSCKLAGGAGEWRIRVGDYRIVYEIHAGRLVVLVIRIAHRREVYR
jgi:mRNA interferase RelE/StbE